MSDNDAEIEEFTLGDDGADFTYSIDEGKADTPAAEHPSLPPMTRSRRPPKPEKIEYEGEEAAKHQGLILRCCRFGQSPVLGAYLASLSFKLTPAHVKTLTISELESLLERIRVSVLNKGGNRFVSTAFFGATKAIEMVVSKNMPCPLYGLSDALSKDASCADLIEFISISRNIGMSSPEMALGMCLMSSVSRVIAINKFLQSREQPPEDDEAKGEDGNEGSKDEPPEPEPKPAVPGVLNFD
jgi:hypothetical protein